MFDQYRLKDVLIQYKQNFVSSQWGNEKYKWEAVKWFQDNWDVNASDFAEMLSRSLDKTFNLLASNNNFPKGMIVGFAKAAPEEVRAMFIALFDESKDVFERMDAFKMQSTVLLEKYGNGAAQHYQYENAISTYLWLRYPYKYYIYKFGEVKAVASELESDYRFKKGAYADNIRNFLKLYDEISVALKEDTELVNLFQSQLTDACYPDPELKTLTIDIGFYISRYYSQKDAAPDTTSWYGADFDPGLTTEDWSKLLKDETVFTTGALEIMKRMKDYGGMASCTQLAVKYGETKNFYNSGSVALARRVCDATGITPNTRDDGSTQWWTVLYTGRDAGKDEDGSFVWKLRDELSAALDKADLSGIELYVAAAPGEQDCGYWWLNANPKIWSFADIAVGEVQSYTLYNENGNKRRIFQNFLDAKAGDMIIGYESNPVKQIVAIGRVSAEQDGEKLFFEKVEGLTSTIDYATLKGCPELERMEYFQNPQGSLFKLTRGEFDFILDMIREENPVTQEGGYEDVATEEFENMHNLFAAILAKGIGRQLKQGLYREYLNRKEDVAVVRGKIDMPGTIQNRLDRKRVLTCEYDELSENNLLNQILKTTVMLLLRHTRVNQEYKSDLKKEMLFFSNVDTIDPTTIRWSAIRFQRNKIILPLFLILIAYHQG